MLPVRVGNIVAPVNHDPTAFNEVLFVVWIIKKCVAEFNRARRGGQKNTGRAHIKSYGQLARKLVKKQLKFIKKNKKSLDVFTKMV
jgi:hypothetical protein